MSGQGGHGPACAPAQKAVIADGDARKGAIRRRPAARPPGTGFLHRSVLAATAATADTVARDRRYGFRFSKPRCRG